MNRWSDRTARSRSDFDVDDQRRQATATGAARVRSGPTTTTKTSRRSRSPTSSLRDHLNSQLALLNLPLRDRQIVSRADRRARMTTAT